MSSSSDAAGRPRPPIRVLVVDDSALIRRVLTEIIKAEADMTVVGAAPDALVARQMIRDLDPDVLTLDVEMPKMNGLEFLEKLMRLRPMPVLMVSTLTQAGSETTLRALELGAVDFIAKPVVEIEHGMARYAEEIVAKIRMAARVPRRRVTSDGAATPVTRLQPVPPGADALDRIVFLGASTGGTEAIRAILQHLPANAPPVLVTQHMPPGFTTTFAARLDTFCAIHVTEAADGTIIAPGHAYIAPGGKHLTVGRRLDRYVTLVAEGAPVNRHVPSVEVLFASAARVAGTRAIAALLTGMGKDGAAALLAIREAGGHTIAQDAATCVVFGMPREAVALGAAMEVLPLPAIAARLMDVATQHSVRAAAPTA